MANYTSPVTKENYLELWRCVWRKYGQAKHSMVTGKLIGIFGELTFLACMLFVTIGMFYSIQIPVICDFLDKIPYLIPMWQKTAVFGLLYPRPCSATPMTGTLRPSRFRK